MAPRKAESAEKRIDPDYPNEGPYTFAEVSSFYAGKFKKSEIKAYWEETCYAPKSKGKAKAKAKAKVQAQPEPKAKAKAKAKVKAKAKAKKEPKPPKSGRFADPWFRKYDTPNAGYTTPDGFVNRLPLRLTSTETFVHGFVDAKKMWDEFADESFHPILVGGKAVISIWFNNFTDTDCGGEYFETWYNTFVTPKSEAQLELDAEGGPMAAIGHPKALIFLQRVVCGDTPNNPGAAKKAIVGGRAIWGFPKHPDVGELSYKYEEEDGKKVKVVFEAKHAGKKVVSLSAKLPETEESPMTIPIDAKTGPDTVIGAPIGYRHNGCHQTRFGQAFKCTQIASAWNASTDKLEFGDDDHYAQPIKRWDFTPILKVHSDDFKIAAFRPSGWVSGGAAAKATRDYEKKLAEGVMGGTLP